MEPDTTLLSDDDLQEDEEVEISAHDESTISIEASLSHTQLLEAMEMRQYPRSVEHMLIFFKHYRQQIQEIGKECGCEVVLGTEKFNIYGPTSQAIEECYRRLSERLLDQISLVKINLKQSNERYLYLNSPWRLKLAAENRCHFTAYLSSVLFVSSDCKTTSELEELNKRLSIATTFRVVYRSFKDQHPVYHEIAKYLRKMLDHNSQIFQDMKMDVEISVREEALHITGHDSKNRTAAKGTVKNFVQQTAILLFQVKQKVDLAALHKYLTNVVAFPWHLAELDPKLFVVITKDSILAKLLSKQKFQNLTEMGRNTTVGMTLLTKHLDDLSNRIQMVRAICNDEGYRLNVEGSNCFFSANITSEKDVDPEKRCANFLTRVLEMFMSANEKFEFNLKSLKKHEQQRARLTHRQPIRVFYEEGECLPLSETQELRKQFGCDIRMIKLRLNADYLARYNDMDGKEETKLLFNVVEGCPPDQTEVVFVNFQKMKGRYFFGRRKTHADKIMYLPQLLVKVIE